MTRGGEKKKEKTGSLLFFLSYTFLIIRSQLFIIFFSPLSFSLSLLYFSLIMFLPKEKVKVPRSLRSARLSVVKNKISTPVIQTTTSAPKKVIKALYDYQAQSPNELSFNRGDFFLVTDAAGAPIDNNFYEAFNPISNSRGIVPVPYFQVLEKHERAMVDSVQKREDHIDSKLIHLHTHI